MGVDFFSPPSFEVASEGSFRRSTKWPKGRVFLFILHQFHMFLKGRIFSTQTLGVAGRDTVVFVDQQNGSKGVCLSSVCMNSACFWKVECFQPRLRGWLEGIVFVHQQNGSKGVCFSSFCINFT